MSNLNASTGTKLYICSTATPAADDESAYEGLSWVEIGGVESIPEFGDAAGQITFNDLSAGRVKKLKGVFDAGDLSIPVAHDPLDAGQVAALAKVASPFNFPFKIVAADAPTEDYTDSTFYFQAKVMSFKSNIADANAVTRRTLALSIDSDIVFVAAASS